MTYEMSFENSIYLIENIGHVQGFSTSAQISDRI